MSVTSQPIAPSTEQNADVPTVPIYRLSVAQYHAMARTGILTEDDPVELLEGWLVRKMTKNPAHCLAMGLIQDALVTLLPPEWHLKVQGSIATADSEPEPDLAVVRGQRRDYLDRHPGPEAVALIVEVADTSLRQDRGSKKRLYARAGLLIYWIVNLIERQIEVYAEPTGPTDPAAEPGYRQRREYGPDDAIPVVLNGVEVGTLLVRDLLP